MDTTTTTKENKKNKQESKVKVRFITNDPNIRVTDTPLAVPVNLGRLGLSEVINHLRNSEEEENQVTKPFDFLINSKFIRTSLDKHIKNANLTEEDVITIEYLEAITEPKKEKECQHDDWISCVEGGLNGLIVSGSYDLGVRVWDNSGNLLSTGTGHLAGVKSVAWINDKNQDALSFVSASLDKTIRLWNFSNTDKIIKATAVLKEHTGTVESVSISPDRQKIMSGSMDSTIKLWNIKDLNSSTPNTSTQTSKKRKAAATEEIHTITESLASVTVPNSQGVTTVSWPTQFQLISGSMDHSIRLWDLNTMSVSETIHTPSPLHDVSYTVESGLIVSAHADRTIRIWDPRLNNTVVTAEGGHPMQTQSLISHKKWVSSAKWKPNSKYHLCSTSLDGSIKYWDIRTKIPLYSIDRLTESNEKLFCSTWITDKPANIDQSLMVSGGSDSKLRIYHDDDLNNK
ncbi:hypothetical protein CYY_008697 [Polysphondylium violaceum]|uniref:Ribosome biogenesis protein WDR12 homolog n=1 Tax=Polysphondylium violaceum TaxID=133409 RepID=A0A8J4PMR3_9MYCE|nr:hypothetical protein CYY_008697 [Polysphondylium violaceum]